MVNDDDEILVLANSFAECKYYDDEILVLANSFAECKYYDDEILVLANSFAECKYYDASELDFFVSINNLHNVLLLHYYLS